MKKFYVLLVFCALFIGVDAAAQVVRYVKEGASGNGSSWENASGDLQAIINESEENDEVWVAAGLYTPKRKADALETLTPDNRFNSFVMKKNVKIYGSFEGTETNRNNRDFVTNASILSGNIGDPAIQTDNAYHVVIASGDLGLNATLNGFIVEDGHTAEENGTSSSVGVNGYGIPSTRSPGIVIYYTTPIEFRNLIIRNNINASGDQGSGGSYIFYGNANFYDTKFVNNVVKNGSAGGIFAFGSLTRTVTVNLTNVEFIGNEANSGGAMSVSTAATVTMNNVTFDSNRSGAGGGAINIASNSAVLLINNSLFKDNVATTSGGGIFTQNNSDVKVYNTRFINNITHTTSTTGGGGAIYASASMTKVYVENCLFEGNKSTVSTSGAIYFGGATAQLSVVNSEFFNNTAERSGGAIYMNNASGNVLIHSSKFYNNSATAMAGAVFVLGSSGAVRTTPRFVNSIFYNNSAGSSGGAFASSTNTRSEFYNVTFFNNTSVSNGTVGHLASSTGSLKLVNSILWTTGNITTATRELSGQSSQTPESYDLTNTMTKIFMASTGTGNTNGIDPLFQSIVDTEVSFLELQAGSSAIDKGNLALLPSDAVIEFDVYRKGRIFNGILDLGALEFGGAPYVSPTIRSIPENTEVDVEIASPNFSLTGTLVNWEIFSGNELGAFKINPATGMVSVADSAPLDFETIKQFTLGIRMSNGLDFQKVYLVIDINNVMEDPGPVKVANIINGNVVTSYRPLLSGSGEFSSTVLIYVIKNDVEELYPATTSTDLEGNWSFRFPQELQPGLTGFRIQTTGDLGTSSKSDIITVNLKLYEGTLKMKATNILTPNGDGKNDVWVVNDLAVMYPKNEVTVYDRTGRVVFKGRNYQNDWDGTYNGQILNTGTYYYVINIGKDLDPIKGTLTILRGR